MRAQQLVEDEFIFDRGSKAMARAAKRAWDPNKRYCACKGWTRAELVDRLSDLIDTLRGRRLDQAETDALTTQITEDELEQLAYILANPNYPAGGPHDAELDLVSDLAVKYQLDTEGD